MAAIVVLAVGIGARISDQGSATARIQADGPVMKAGKPVIYTANDLTATR
jgi:hypothetical protein